MNEEAVELAWTGNAYLDCARRICSSLLEDGDESSIHHNRVPLHLIHVALELFYKSSLMAVRRHYPPIHDLVKLESEYRSALPELPLELPSFLHSLASPDLFESKRPKPSEVQHERYRYFSDRTGRPFPELDMVNLQQLQKDIDSLSRNANKIMQGIWKICGFK